ncbi:unnamed protein product [Heterobilharzia americana]|nr:unnamed protein product [Heterobilharzia americana]
MYCDFIVIQVSRFLQTLRYISASSVYLTKRDNFISPVSVQIRWSLTMTSLLVTTTSEKQVDAAIVWDPLGGNPVASLSGDLASRASITGYFGGVACSAARKPIIQTWNFHSAVTHFFSAEMLIRLQRTKTF